MTDTRYCLQAVLHAGHTWRWGLRRYRCPGVLVALPCGRADGHSPHFVGEFHDELCRGEPRD